MATTYQSAIDARSDLEQYGNNALLLFALELKLQIEDIHTVAADALTDNPDDKKCDLVYVDRDAGYIVVAQTYISSNPTKSGAPANKAADLNTAASWLFSRPLADLPEGLRPSAQALRSALVDNAIRVVQFWYVHNLRESKNVGNELRTVEMTVRNALKSDFPTIDFPEVNTIEVGRTVLEEWYKGLENPILVSDEFEIPVQGGYEISSDDWKAYATAIPASWLHKTFKIHGADLFSANVRGYPGSEGAWRRLR